MYNLSAYFKVSSLTRLVGMVNLNLVNPLSYYIHWAPSIDLNKSGENLFEHLQLFQSKNLNDGSFMFWSVLCVLNSTVSVERHSWSNDQEAHRYCDIFNSFGQHSFCVSKESYDYETKLTSHGLWMTRRCRKTSETEQKWFQIQFQCLVAVKSQSGLKLLRLTHICTEQSLPP